MTGKGRSQNKSKREEEARSRGFVGADRESWVDAALTRASRRGPKKPTRRAPGPPPPRGVTGDREIPVCTPPTKKTAPAGGGKKRTTRPKKRRHNTNQT